jgi:hypothetical protein
LSGTHTTEEGKNEELTENMNNAAQDPKLDFSLTSSKIYITTEVTALPPSFDWK